MYTNMWWFPDVVKCFRVYYQRVVVVEHQAHTGKPFEPGELLCIIVIKLLITNGYGQHAALCVHVSATSKTMCMCVCMRAVLYVFYLGISRDLYFEKNFTGCTN